MIALLTTVPAAHAGFDFSFFRLRTGTQDRTGPSIISDFETISTADNEIHAFQDTGIGTGYARTQFDVSWLEYTGIFNAAVEQHIEEREFNTSTRLQIEFMADVDLLFTVDSELAYSSSASDTADIKYRINIRDLNAGFPPHFEVEHRGGAATLKPDSGIFITHESVILPAGTSYRIDHLLTLDSITVDPPQHAPIDVSGYMNFSIAPVPEPGTSTLLVICFAAFLRRRR